MEMCEGVEAPSTTTSKPHIVSIAILDGDESKALGAIGKQWVNLPKDAKWVDGTDVVNLDRLGPKLRFKVCFDEPGAHAFKVKFKPGTGNTLYSGAEKGRNSTFKYEETEKSYTTDGNGIKIVADDFFVDAAGNNTFQLVAKDNENNEVESGSVANHRLVHYVELKMTGLTSVASSLSTMIGEFGRNNIKMVGLPSVTMDYMPNIDRVNQNTDFPAKARTAYTGSQGPSKEPYVIAIAYTDHLAVKQASLVKHEAGVTVGPGVADVSIDIEDPTTSSTKYLWNKIVPGEGWFVSAVFLKDGGTPGTDDVVITAADCTLVPESPGNPDRSAQVKIKVSGLAAATGTISLKVDVVDMMRGGVSLGGNIICICTRAWWADKSTTAQNQTMIHELGHQFNMVADGSGTGPDSVATLYSGKGHRGNHCHEGLPVQADYSGATGASCVMFGATNPSTAFCANCAPAVLKQDLSAGFSKF